MEECFKSNHSQDSYSAQIRPIDDRIPNNHIREHCLANLSQLNMIRIDRCQQVRIERPAFHGWRDESICIGGTMSPNVKQLIKEVITKVVPDSIEVK